MDHDGAAPIEGATREVAGHTVTDLLLVDIPAVPRPRARSGCAAAGPEVEAAVAEPTEPASGEPWPGVPPLPWPVDPPEAA